MESIKENSRASWLYTAPAGTIADLVIAIVAAALFVNVIRLKRNDPKRPDPKGTLLVLGALEIIGLRMACRGGTTLDGEERILTRWYGRSCPSCAARSHSMQFAPSPSARACGRAIRKTAGRQETGITPRLIPTTERSWCDWPTPWMTRDPMLD
jgi:hypothetical protein